jgi:hypothetical protein
LRLARNDFVNEEQLAAARALPDEVEVRERDVPLEYDVEELDGALVPVVRLRLPEKVARTLVVEELPVLDRPLRFAVTRGQRGSVRASDLATLQERLDDPYTDEERERAIRARDEQAERSRDGRNGRGNGQRGGNRGSRNGGSRGGPRGDGRPGGKHGGGGRRGGGVDADSVRHAGSDSKASANQWV